MTEYVEEVELNGHILDSLLLAKVLDAIIAHGGTYVIRHIRLGQRQEDASEVRVQVRAASSEQLHEILNVIHDHGAVSVHISDCTTIAADIEGAFPEGFYCTTNFRTQVRLASEWVDVEDQEMDCGIVIDPAGKAARCVAMTAVRIGDRIVVGRQGTRVFPQESQQRTDLFEFMASPVSSEKPKGVTVREIAAAMRRTRAAGEKILAVLGPAVVHTGGSEWVSWLIRNGYLQTLFAGNALATHDIEQAFYGTSLGVSLEHAASPRKRGTSTTCGPLTPSAAWAASETPCKRVSCKAASCTNASGRTSHSCWRGASATMARFRKL